MNSRNWLIVIVIVAVLAIGGWFIFKGKSSTSPSPSPSPAMSMSPQASSSPSSSSASTSQTQGSAVTIQNFAFSPASMTVKKGTTVTWTNKDSAGHTVVEADGQAGGPSSGTLANGQSYQFTFNTVGTFHYKCGIHPQMTGTVTVTE